MREVDIELNAAEQALELVDSPPADEVAKREHDRLGLGRAAQHRSRLLDQGFGEIQCGTHTITLLLYASLEQARAVPRPGHVPERLSAAAAGVMIGRLHV